MFFKGTSRHSAKELAHLFDDLGGQVNAFTAKEFTCFYARVLDEHFSIALETLAEMLTDSRFAPEEMEKEKRVVIEEIRMYEDTPDELVMDLIARGVYGDHPLGYAILGRDENLLRFSRDDLVRYVDRHYRPDRMVIAVAGHVPEDVVIREVSGCLGGWCRGRPVCLSGAAALSQDRDDGRQGYRAGAHLPGGARLSRRIARTVSLAFAEQRARGYAILAVVSGNSRGARHGLLGVLVPHRLPGRGHVRHLRGHVAGDGRGGARPCAAGHGAHVAGAHLARGTRKGQATGQGGAHPRPRELGQSYEPPGEKRNPASPGRAPGGDGRGH